MISAGRERVDTPRDSRHGHIGGVRPFTAGLDHLSHRLQDRGSTVPGSVLLLQIVSVGGAVTAVAVAAALS